MPAVPGAGWAALRPKADPAHVRLPTEAENLVRRFRAGHEVIQNWDFYRYDQLPPMTKQQRVALERMMIRAFASVLDNKRGIPTKSVSDYRLANNKIDS